MLEAVEAYKHLSVFISGSFGLFLPVGFIVNRLRYENLRTKKFREFSFVFFSQRLRTCVGNREWWLSLNFGLFTHAFHLQSLKNNTGKVLLLYYQLNYANRCEVCAQIREI